MEKQIERRKRKVFFKREIKKYILGIDYKTFIFDAPCSKTHKFDSVSCFRSRCKVVPHEPTKSWKLYAIIKFLKYNVDCYQIDQFQVKSMIYGIN